MDIPKDQCKGNLAERGTWRGKVAIEDIETYVSTELLPSRKGGGKRRDGDRPHRSQSEY